MSFYNIYFYIFFIIKLFNTYFRSHLLILTIFCFLSILDFSYILENLESFYIYSNLSYVNLL